MSFNIIFDRLARAHVTARSSGERSPVWNKAGGEKRAIRWNPKVHCRNELVLANQASGRPARKAITMTEEMEIYLAEALFLGLAMASD